MQIENIFERIVDNPTDCSEILTTWQCYFMFEKHFSFALVFELIYFLKTFSIVIDFPNKWFFRKKRKHKKQFPLKINANGIKIKIKTVSIENQWKQKSVFFGWLNEKSYLTWRIPVTWQILPLVWTVIHPRRSRDRNHRYRGLGVNSSKFLAWRV